jgi:anthranilate/para-aminobenzoate synthase component I
MSSEITKQVETFALSYAVPAVDWFSIIKSLPQPILLHSGHSSHAAARFDILTADPRKLFRTRDGLTTVETPSKAVIESSTADPFEVLASQGGLLPGLLMN